MNLLAQQALARARTSVRQPVAKPATRVTKTPVYATSPTIYATPAPVYAPIPAPGAPATDQYHQRMGKQYALDIVESCGAQVNTVWGLNDLLARLEKSKANKPASFVRGLNTIVDVLRAHMAELPAERPTL
jgi:hypothetical protein